jgi:Cys-tRNA(Pro)/Cys-tRNA(Cys) deacylase
VGTRCVPASHAYRDLDERGLVDLTETPGMRAAEAAGIGFEVVRTERPSTAEESASLQGIELGQLLRTIVIRRGADDYVFVLVPGGRQIDWPKLRAHLGVKRLSLPSAEEAKEATGYERGAITPFGATHAWPVIADAATHGFDVVAIGAGAHGVNLHVDSSSLLATLYAEVADVTRPDGPAPTP